MCLPISPVQHKYHEYVPDILELKVFKDSILNKVQVVDRKKRAASQRTAACNPKSRQADNDDSVIQ